MRFKPSYTHLALRLAAKGLPIPLSEETSHLLPALLWSGHLIDISLHTGDTEMRATLSSKGRSFLDWLDE
jgi:hypothetical protein